VTGSVADHLRVRFGLDSVDVRAGLTQEELFAAAIDGDRGRTRLDGAEHDQKAFATALGADGPLIFYSDPTCTGRPVQPGSEWSTSGPSTPSRVAKALRSASPPPTRTRPRSFAIAS